MLAVAYCYLVSVYAELTLHSLQFADNVGWRTTTSFIFPSDVLFITDCRKVQSDSLKTFCVVPSKRKSLISESLISEVDCTFFSFS